MATPLRRNSEQPSGSSSFDQVPGRLDVQIYSKLAATFGVSATVRQAGDSVLSIMLPGYYVDPNMDPRDAMTQYELSNAVNPLLACSWRVQPGVGLVSDVYKAILDGKEAPLPDLDPREQKLLDDALSYLFTPDGTGDPSPAYEDYLGYRELYLTALARLDTAIATKRNGGPPVPQKLRRELQKALDAWETNGHRAKVDRSIDVITLYGGRDPARYWADLMDRYRNATRQAEYGSEYQYVTCVPPYPDWFGDFGWLEFTFDDSDFLEQDRSGVAGQGPTCCCTSGGTAPAGEGLSASTIEPSAMTVEDEMHVVMRCDLRIVQILRPWLDPTVFSSRAWRWSQASTSYGTVISSGGDIVGMTVPSGAMPLLPTALVLSRDLELYWLDDTATASAVFDRIGTHGGRVGPFSLTRASLTEEGHIVMRDPQIVGYLSTILQRCPNPDATLPWPVHASSLMSRA